MIRKLAPMWARSVTAVRGSVDAVRAAATRPRLEALGVATAFAVVVGLSAPAAGVVDTSTSDPTVQRTTVSQAAQSSFTDTADDLVTAVTTAQAPSTNELYPVTITATQARFTPTHEQLANAKAIVEAGQALGLPPRAWTIAVATSLQESNLRNLGNLGARNDHDSLGLFQQRPSSGWGTPTQVQNPTYAATAFYKRLVKVPGWDSMALTRAAQKVQVSAYPNHYAKHEVEAGDIIWSLYGTGPYADLATDLRF